MVPFPDHVLWGSSFIFDSFGRILLMIGGFMLMPEDDYPIYPCTTCAHAFDNDTAGKWSRFPVETPEDVAFYASAITQDGRYILLFGGSDATGEAKDGIYYMDAKEKTWNESRLLCPLPSYQYQAVIMNNLKSSNFVTSGYIRKELKKTRPQQPFPSYLVDIVALYCPVEEIHLVLSGGESGSVGHWVARMDDIL